MDLNNRKMTNHPPYPLNPPPYAVISEFTINGCLEFTIDSWPLHMRIDSWPRVWSLLHALYCNII